MIGPITNPRWQAWAAKALAEDRLHCALRRLGDPEPSMTLTNGDSR